jgi:NADH:ubiquinone oxidoreductase subunit 2 (subunit N)
VVSAGFLEPVAPWLAELVLVAGAVALPAMSRLKSAAVRAGDAALLVLAASAVAVVASNESVSRLAAGGLVAIDPFAAFFRFALSMTALAAAWLASRASEIETHGDAPPAAWSAFLLSVAGMDLMVSSANVLAAWTGFAIATLASALWMGLRRPGSALAASPALVLLLERAAASVLMLAGFAMLYGLAGTFAFDEMNGRLAVALAAPGGRISLTAAAVLVLAGAFANLGLVPWERSRVELAARGPWSDAAWFLVAPGLAMLAMLTRFLRSALSAPVPDGEWARLANVDWPAVVSFAAIVTMTLGNVAALREANVRRLVAWLSVSQAGHLAMGLAAGSDKAVEAMLFHAIVVAMMTFGVLAALAPVVDQAGSDHVEVLRGLARRRGSARAAAAMIAVFVLGFSAVWPLAGHTGRALLIEAQLRGGGTFVAACAAVASAIGLLVLIRIVATMLDRPEDAEENVTMDFEAVVLAGAMAGAVVGFGIWPDPLAELARRSVVFFGG